MALNFPNAPAIGDTHEGYAWDGEKWIVSSGSAGSVPAPGWVPEGATIFIDFMNSRAWDGMQVLDAVGIGQLLGNDSTSNLWMGGSYYSPDAIGPDGYDHYIDPNAQGYGPAALGKFKDMLLDGVTVVTTYAYSNQYTQLYSSFSNLSGESAVEMYTYNETMAAFPPSSSSIVVPNALDMNIESPSQYTPNRIAMTVTEATAEESGRLEIASNGGEAWSQMLGLADFPEGPTAALYLDGVPLQSIAVYPPQPLAMLSDLSDMDLPAQIDYMQPTEVTTEMNFTMEVHGNHFEAEDVIQIDGVDIATLFVTRKSLRAAEIITAPATAGAMAVTLNTALGVIDVGSITVSEVVVQPTLTGAEPTTLVAGSVGATFDAIGIGFLPNHIVSFAQVQQETVFVDETRLTAINVAVSSTPQTVAVGVSDGTYGIAGSAYIQIVAPTVESPEWVPDGAQVHIDFLNSRGWDGAMELDATGIGTLVGSDPDVDDAIGGSSTYVFSANVAGMGYCTNLSEAVLCLRGRAKELISLDAGAIVVVQYYMGTEVSQSIFKVLNQVGDIGMMCTTDRDAATVYLAAPPTVFAASEPCIIGTPGTISKVATMTIPGTSALWASGNGLTQFGGLVDYFTSLGNRLYATCAFFNSGGNYIQSITIYPSDSPALLPPYSALDAPSSPAWVSEGALMSIDFRTPGKSWDGSTEGDGTTGIAALIGNDPDATNYAGPTGYNASGLNAAGYDYQIVADNSPAYIGALKAAVLGECSVVVTIAGKTGLARHAPTISLMSADALAGIEVMTDGYDVTAVSKTGALNLRLTSCFIPPATEMYYRNRLGFTITATRFDIAANGFGSVAGVIDATDRPAENPFACVVEWGNDIEMIEVFPPCADAYALNILTSLSSRSVDEGRSAGKRLQDSRFAQARARIMRAQKEEK